MLSILNIHIYSHLLLPSYSTLLITLPLTTTTIFLSPIFLFQIIHKMMNTKKLLKLARKWQKLAAIRRKRVTVPSTTETTHTSSCSTSAKAEKGCFVVYSADQKRFLLPLEYLNNEIIIELFNMAEEEFGLPSNAPLTLPCDSELLEFAISLIRQRVTSDVERSLLSCIDSCSSSSLHFPLQHNVTSHQLPIYSF